jgi:hypothetical protein
VNSSRVFRWVIALLIPLSIAWKVAAHSSVPEDVIGRLSLFLLRNDFIVDSPEKLVNSETTTADLAVIHASNPGCGLEVAQLKFDSSNRQVIEARFASAEDRFVVFRGRVYAKRPEVAILATYAWARIWRDFGFAPRVAPVIAVAAKTACHAEQLPWAEL